MKMIREFVDIHQASIAAVKHITSLAESAVMDKGFFTIVLAGGSTPQHTYELLSEPANAVRMDWEQSHFFWGDERWVDSTNPDSNFGLAQKNLLSKVAIPHQNIHQITTGHTDPVIGAAMYEKHLRNFFHSVARAETNGTVADMIVPRFDLILLGMGTDGHTASLFPGSEILSEQKKWVAAVEAGTGSPPLPRITLTLPILNRAKNILFLISGSRKREILDTILTRPTEAEVLYPAACIRPTGNLIWMVAENG